MFIERMSLSFRRLQWKLTLSYAAVTVGSLSVVVLILGYLLFSRAFIPLDIYDTILSPEGWIRLVSEDSVPLWRTVLSQEPIDTRLISALLQRSDLQITAANILQIGDFQIRMNTAAQGSAFIVDPDAILLGAASFGASSSNLISEDDIGQPLNTGILPGLENALEVALSGETDPERLFVTLEPHERFYFAAPVMDEANQEILGVMIVYIERMPTANDIPSTVWTLLGRSILILLLAAGVVGTVFGALTASGMARRLERVSQVIGAWSRGDFSQFIDDPSGDEIGQLALRLNNMAELLQQFIKRSQEMAISEERSRLARDLHDSAKQEALAASFHLGTSLALFERDPDGAREHLVEADSLVDSVRRELTDLIHELRPPSVDSSRFDETINEYLTEWAHQTGIGASIIVEGYVDLSLEIKQAIYRIMQEALANVARHSSAKEVRVDLSFQGNAVELSISDDGSGFDPQGQHNGMGLASMSERAVALGGQFSIESKPGQGTKVRVTFPTR